MFVRLATDWTGPGETRHRAGDVVEVDNVTLAELEAGGYVATEDANEPKKKDRDEDAQQKPRNESQSTESDDSGEIKPDSWPGIS